MRGFVILYTFALMDINELIPDDRNANKHSKRGMKMLKNALANNGLGRSILISDDNVVIAGNGTLEMAKASGIKKVKIIDTDGETLIAVRRTDIDSGTKEFYQMALDDNFTAKENIIMDAEVVDAIVEEFDIELAEAKTETLQFKKSSYDDEDFDEDQDEDFDPLPAPPKPKPGNEGTGEVPLYINILKADMVRWEKIIKALKSSPKEVFKVLLNVYEDNL